MFSKNLRYFKPLHFLLFVIAVTLTACTDNKDEGGGKDALPQTPEEAISKLSEYHKTSFENWKAKVAKSCDSSMAFGLSVEPGTEVGVDGRALLNRNAGSLVHTSAGAIAVLTGYRSLNGEVRTESESTYELNGESTTIQAKTERLGSNCVVYLFGQKVYETYLAESFVVGAEARPNKGGTSQSTTAPLIENVGSMGAVAARDSALGELLTEALKPSAEIRDSFGVALGLSPLESQKLLLLSPFPQTPFAVKLADEASALWNMGDARALIASRHVLENIFRGANQSLGLDMRIAIPEMKFMGHGNSSDRASLDVGLLIHLDRTTGAWAYRLDTMQFRGRRAFKATEASTCLYDRVANLYVSASNRTAILPSLNVAMGPCRVLNREADQAAFDSGAMKNLIGTLFSGVVPSANFDYAGWNAVVSRLSLSALKQSKDIRAELDPQNRTALIPIIAQHLSALKVEVSGVPHGAVYSGAAYQMGLDWSYWGQRVPHERIATIIRSVDVAGDTFKASVERLLSDLGREPYSRDAELQYARSLDANFKAEAVKALGLAKELEEPRFEQDIFNVVLQRRVSIQELQSWSQVLSIVKNEILKYSNLTPQKAVLAGLAVKWLKSGEVTGAELPGVYQALSNVIDAFPVSTKELLNTLSRSMSEGRESLAFARAIGADYKVLALQLVQAAKAAGYENWGQDFLTTILQRRPNLAQVQSWSGMWRSILSFVDREKARLGSDMAAGAEWRRKDLIDKAVKESWSELEFQGLEVLAVVAKAKSTCDYHKDVSSIVDCAGKNLFSKSARMFFDPGFQNRYTDLAQNFQGYLNRMTDFKWSSLRREIVSELFGSWEPLWSKCDNNMYSQKFSEFKVAMNQLLAQPDSFQRFEQERKVRELMKNCN